MNLDIEPGMSGEMNNETTLFRSAADHCDDLLCITLNTDYLTLDPRNIALTISDLVHPIYRISHLQRLKIDLYHVSNTGADLINISIFSLHIYV